MSIATLADFTEAVTKAYNAAHNYYNTDVDSDLTDAEYDLLVEELEAAADAHPDWVTQTPLYQGLVDEVAAGTADGGDVKHDIPMLSLKKSKTFDEVSSFLGNISGNVIVEPKLDGSAISVKYRDGKMVQAVTRGNGQEGKDVTARIKRLVGLPVALAEGFNGEVRGEIYMTDEQFADASDARLASARSAWEESAQKAVAAGRQPKEWRPEDFTFSNSRNAVSGLINRESTAGFDFTMSFAAYDVITDNAVDSYFENMQRIQALGVIPAFALLGADFQTVTSDKDEVSKRIETIGAEREGYAFPIDGAVIKTDSLRVRAAMGVGSRHPRWALAYKYEADSGVTTVEDIMVNVGRTGRLSLRARIKPVQVGTLLTYVSLHNVDWLRTKDIRIGDTVKVTRRNDVIPQIEEVLVRDPASAPWEAPEACPKCGEPWNKETLLWRCETPACGAVNMVIHASKRDYFDWDGMSEAVITRLFDVELISSVADVFSLSEHELSNLIMRYTDSGTPVLLGEKVGKKIYAEIQKSKDVPLARVIAALGIRTLGRTFGKRLSAHFGSMEAICSASIPELQNVEGISRKAEVIHAGLRKNADVIAALAAAGVNMVADKPSAAVDGGAVLTGKNVCVTGSMKGSALDGLTRTQVQELIESHGGRAASSVSSSTHILVAAETGSSKYKKALTMGDKIQILSPQDFAGLLGM